MADIGSNTLLSIRLGMIDIGSILFPYYPAMADIVINT